MYHPSILAMANDKCSVPKDWAELNLDLLPLIAHKLGDIIDFIRFRAVCKQWRLATNLSDNPPQFPWLMMLELNRNSNISFHAIPSDNFFSINELVTTKIS
ncbi:F-box protein [Carex littledalei]|uniref:F-box protein n=1 Tax=Carex littledalei TaxID=544730 RepID=A0A833RI34_9POAL|nr:F-box protein [Carex littledalei]